MAISAKKDELPDIAGLSRLDLILRCQHCSRLIAMIA